MAGADCTRDGMTCIINCRRRADEVELRQWVAEVRRREWMRRTTGAARGAGACGSSVAWAERVWRCPFSQFADRVCHTLQSQAQRDGMREGSTDRRVACNQCLTSPQWNPMRSASRPFASIRHDSAPRRAVRLPAECLAMLSCSSDQPAPSFSCCPLANASPCRLCRHG